MASDAQNAVFGAALDFMPVVGDIKGFVDAYNDPSFGNIAAAVVGLAGPIGDGLGKAIKTGSHIAKEAGKASKATSQIDRAAFAKERSAFWKNEASSNSSNYEKSDIARMEKGKPPIGPDGHPMELHHKDGTMGGGVEPMSRTDHRLGDNYKKNHPR